MTRDQLKALERWIVAVIKDEAPHSDGSDYLFRAHCYKEVLVAFNLEAKDHD